MGRTACAEPQPVQYSYTSTSPMGRTACTEPQPVQRCTLNLPYATVFPLGDPDHPYAPIQSG